MLRINGGRSINQEINMLTNEHARLICLAHEIHSLLLNEEEVELLRGNNPYLLAAYGALHRMAVDDTSTMMDKPTIPVENEACSSWGVDMGKSKKECVWAEDQDGNWFTDCHHAFEITDGTPDENGFKFCAYCGKDLIQARYYYEYAQGCEW